jgi:hypothetical protein
MATLIVLGVPEVVAEYIGYMNKLLPDWKVWLLYSLTKPQLI